MNLKHLLPRIFPVFLITGLLIPAVYGGVHAILLGFAGAPGEETCQHCHADLPVNGGPGKFSISSSSPTYSPGETLFVSLQLSDSGLRHWCFQATELNTSLHSVGTLIIPDTVRFHIFKIPEGRSYIESTFAGGGHLVADTSPTWTIAWLPDSVYGPITFYAAGMGVNLDSALTGDRVYKVSLTVQPSVAVCCTFDRGMIDCVPGLDIADLVAETDYLFGSLQPLCCSSMADLDFNGIVDLADLTSLIDHLFLSMSPLPTCSD